MQPVDPHASHASSHFRFTDAVAGFFVRPEGPAAKLVELTLNGGNAVADVLEVLEEAEGTAARHLYR